MLIACGTSTFTRQYGTDTGPVVAVPVKVLDDASRIVTGGSSPTSVTDPMPALSQVVTGEIACASPVNTAAANAGVEIGRNLIVSYSMLSHRGHEGHGGGTAACIPIRYADHPRYIIRIQGTIANNSYQRFEYGSP
jgi:hypothetical protein